MKSRNKYFLNFAILFVVLFIVGAISLIFGVIIGSKVPEAKQSENILGLVALVFYIVIVAVLFYQALKAYLIKSRLVSIVMVNDRGEKNPKSYRNALIFGCVFAAITIFFALNTFGIINVLSFFTFSLTVTLTNFTLMISSIGFYLYLYKPEHLEDEEN